MTSRTAAPRNTQTFFLIESENQFVIHRPSFPLQQPMKPATAKLHASGCKVTQTNSSLCPIIGCAPVAITRSWATHQTAGATFGHFASEPQFIPQSSPSTGIQSVFDRTSCSIFLSRLRSATSCFRLRFSSSTCFNRRSSATPRPSFFFHR